MRLLLLGLALAAAAFPSAARSQAAAGEKAPDNVRRDIDELNRLLENYREPPPPPRKRPPPKPPAEPAPPLPAEVDELVVLLLEGNRSERAAAQKRLIETGTGAIDELSRLLLKGDERSGITAAGVLGLIGEPAAADPLAAALESPSRRVRTAAARALGRIDAPLSLSSLSDALDDRESVVREAALRSLVGKGEAAIPWLIESTRHDRPGIRSQAARALADLTGESFGENFPEWHRWWDEKSGENSPGGKIPR